MQTLSPKSCFPCTEENQGPVVQSMVSLTSSLITNSLTVVAEIFSNKIDIFAAKMCHPRKKFSTKKYAELGKHLP